MTRSAIVLFIVCCIFYGCKSEEVAAPPPIQKTEEARSVGKEGGETQPQPLRELRPPEPTAAISESQTPNRPPELSAIKIGPRLVYPGTKIKIEPEGKDEDGDTVSFYYEWKRNDSVIEGEIMDELDTAGFKRGDFVTVTVTPFDGKEKGKPRRTLPLVIANRPPEITSEPPSDLSNERYIYDVKATDPDGDKLTYFIEGSPPGMTIDSETGTVRWEVPKDLKSGTKFKIKITVSDGDAKAIQGFELSPIM